MKTTNNTLMIGLVLIGFFCSFSLATYAQTSPDTVVIGGHTFEVVLISASDVGMNEKNTFPEIVDAAKKKLGLETCPFEEVNRFCAKIPIVGKGCVNIPTENFIARPNSGGTLWVYQIWEMGPHDGYPYIEGYQAIAGWTSKSHGRITYYELASEIRHPLAFLKPKG